MVPVILNHILILINHIIVALNFEVISCDVKLSFLHERASAGTAVAVLLAVIP